MWSEEKYDRTNDTPHRSRGERCCTEEAAKPLLHLAVNPNRAGGPAVDLQDGQLAEAFVS